MDFQTDVLDELAERLAVGRIEFNIFCQNSLPPVTVCQKFLLIVKQFLRRLGREFEIRSLDDGIDRTGLLAQPAIDALHHVDVVAHGAAGASLRRGPASMVIACAGQIASHSLQAMQRSSPLG